MMTVVPPTLRAGVQQLPPPPHAPRTPRMTAVLRALFLKELRQNFAYLLLAAIPIAVAAYLVGLFATLTRASASNDPTLNILQSPAACWGVAIGCILAGLSLGIAQPLADRPLDLWAFLVHRPVSRSTLFLGRALAGFFMYVLIAVLPVLGFILYAATPRGGEFFTRYFATPALLSCLLGLVFYLAGLLISQRKARLYGSRTLPLVAAIACAALVPQLSSLTLAFAIILGSALLFALAAWGAALSHGYTLRSPLLPRIATGIVLAVSLAIPFSWLSRAEDVAATVAGEWLAQFAPSPVFPRHAIDSGPPVSKLDTILPDGTAGTLVTEYHDDVPVRRYYERRDKTDPTPVPVYKERPASSESPDRLDFNVDLVLTQTLHPDQNPPTSSVTNLSGIVDRTEVRAALPDQTSYVKERWYNVRPQGLLYGYDGPTGAFLGTLGANGFAPPGTRATPFSPTARQLPMNNLTLSGNALYEVNIPGHQVVKRYEIPAGSRVLDIAYPLFVERNRIPVDFIPILTDHHVILYSTDTRVPSLLLPLATPLQGYHLDVAAVDQGRWAIWYKPDADASLENIVDTFTPDGKLLRHTQFPSQEKRLPLPYVRNQQWEVFDAVFDSRLALSNLPLLYTLPLNIDGAHVLLDLKSPRPVHVSLRSYTFILTLLLLALAAYALARRYALKHPSAWALLAIALGPIALPLLIVTHTLPHRFRCPACHKKRFLNGAACPRCRAPFPTPASTGTEIFSAANHAHVLLGDIA